MADARCQIRPSLLLYQRKLEARRLGGAERPSSGSRERRRN